jgi:hypothetical protein
MHAMISQKTLKLSAAAVQLFAGLVVLASAFGQNEPPAPLAADHLPPVSAKINALAHRVLAAGVKANGLSGAGAQPWHMNLSYQIVQPGQSKPLSGTLEEWYTGQYAWGRTYSGADGRPEFSGSEWSVAKTVQYQSKRLLDFDHRYLNLRVARPASIRFIRPQTSSPIMS